jgi:hypothetical protein
MSDNFLFGDSDAAEILQRGLLIRNQQATNAKITKLHEIESDRLDLEKRQLQLQQRQHDLMNEQLRRNKVRDESELRLNERTKELRKWLIEAESAQNEIVENWSQLTLDDCGTIECIGVILSIKENLQIVKSEDVLQSIDDIKLLGVVTRVNDGLEEHIDGFLKTLRDEMHQIHNCLTQIADHCGSLKENLEMVYARSAKKITSQNEFVELSYEIQNIKTQFIAKIDKIVPGRIGVVAKSSYAENIWHHIAADPHCSFLLNYTRVFECIYAKVFYSTHFLSCANRDELLEAEAALWERIFENINERTVGHTNQAITLWNSILGGNDWNKEVEELVNAAITCINEGGNLQKSVEAELHKVASEYEKITTTKKSLLDYNGRKRKEAFAALLQIVERMQREINAAAILQPTEALESGKYIYTETFTAISTRCRELKGWLEFSINDD